MSTLHTHCNTSLQHLNLIIISAHNSKCQSQPMLHRPALFRGRTQNCTQCHDTLRTPIQSCAFCPSHWRHIENANTVLCTLPFTLAPQQADTGALQCTLNRCPAHIIHTGQPWLILQHAEARLLAQHLHKQDCLASPMARADSC